MNKANEQKLQEKVMIYQILSQQLEEFANQGQVLEARLSEIEVTIEALNDMKNVIEGSESLVPLGSGCFGHGNISKKDNVVIDVGAGIMIEKPIAEALKIIKGRKSEVDNVKIKLQSEIEKIGETMNKLNEELQEIQAAEEGKKSPKSPGNDDIIVD